MLVRLLQTVEPDKWSTLLKQDENDDRREFLRAIDAVKKRTQRARKTSGLADEVADRRFAPEVGPERAARGAGAGRRTRSSASGSSRSSG